MAENLPARRDRSPRRSKLLASAGLIGGMAVLAAGGVAAGIELERRIVSKRLRRNQPDEDEPFFSLRASGPKVTTPDGVVLHTEVDELEPGDSAEYGDVTVVLVHGYVLSLDCWHFQRKHFRGKARTVLYDLRSHGRSSRSDPELCRIPQLARDLEQVITEVVGDGPVVLVGHSLGAMTIMELARRRPEWVGTRIVGAGLVSTSAGDLSEVSLVRGLPGSAFNRIAEPLLATLNRVPKLVEKGRKAGTDLGYVVTKQMSFGRDDVPVSYVEFMSEMLGAMPLEVVADYYPGFGDVDLRDALAELDRIECAVIGGEDDLVTPVRHTDRIIEHLPGADTLRLPKAGHMAILEWHEQVNEVLDALVARARRHLPEPVGGDTSPGDG